MATMTRQLRELLIQPGIIVQPAVARPFEAMIAQDLGCQAVALGGYALGASLGLSEPLVSLGDLEAAALAITRVATIPLMVDAGAGYGDQIHVRSAIRRLEQAGVAAIHIEDQVYPKRVHYHRGVEEIVGRDAMMARIEAACSARTDPDLVIVARTDAMLTDGYEEGIARARLYRSAGADMLMLFPNNEAEARRAPQDISDVPLIYVNSSGNRLGRGVFSTADLASWSWKMDYESSLVTNVTMQAVERTITALLASGLSQEDSGAMVRARKRVEDVIGLNALYAVESRDLGIEGGV